MKRKIGFCILLMFVLIIAVGCSRGEVDDVQITIGESEFYSNAELRAAANEILHQFSKGFDGCTLKELNYDEEESLKQADEWKKQYEAEEAIVFSSRFTVSPFYKNGPLSPGDTHYYSWVLVRNKGGNWNLKDWGY